MVTLKSLLLWEDERRLIWREMLVSVILFTNRGQSGLELCPPFHANKRSIWATAYTAHINRQATSPTATVQYVSSLVSRAKYWVGYNDFDNLALLNRSFQKNLGFQKYSRPGRVYKWHQRIPSTFSSSFLQCCFARNPSVGFLSGIFSPDRDDF
jgi:hypothetical protein